jgi:hypothetical protein
VAFAIVSSDGTVSRGPEVVQDWGLSGTHDKIPSVISYSPATEVGEQQWGLSLSPDAVAMVNTKLEVGDFTMLKHVEQG